MSGRAVQTKRVQRRRKAPPGAGRPVRGSRTGRPIMVLLDLLGRRWALRILWVLRGDAQGFNELQQGCDGMSPSVLNQRLVELRDAGIVEVAPGGRYGLSRAGRDLLRALAPLDAFAKRWGAARAAST
jgi:DNA-binding HxlR family transcriptional regulator